jgi:primase-like protein
MAVIKLNEPRGALEEAINFLRRFHPTSLWALTSFGPASGQIGPADTFALADEVAARRFLDKVQGNHNVYFTVNCVRDKLSKKASKRDIVEVPWLHVDADLNKTINWSNTDGVEAEKARVLAKLRSYAPAPTVIVWSGGGYQAFWRLSEIIVVNGDPALMQSSERRMQRIEKALGADPCHNVDRIMRLPGTLNVLGPTKIRAGRKPALAEVIEFHDDRIYDIEDFPEADIAHGYGDRPPANDDDEIPRVREALKVVPADDYNVYLRIGMALRNRFGDAGFDLYRDWAVTSAKFDEIELRRKWTSITSEGGVTIATLYGIAREHGWRPERHAVTIIRQSTEGASPEQASVKAWPILDSTAAQGLIGEIAKLATRESEADPVAVMATTLAWGAACFGRNRFYRVGDTIHHARLFCALVGASSRARKGTSLGPVERIFREAEGILRGRSTLPFPSGLPLNVSHGLSSGEGLIAEIRDERDGEEGGGVDDKRLLVVESEFGAVLRHFQRQGNTLSSTLRNAWDGRDLGTMTKSSRDRATDPHICLLGHITRQELDTLLTSADIWNGVANRFLWAAVRRNKLVPFAQPMPDGEVAAIGSQLADAIQFAHGRDRMDAELTMSNSARDFWMAIYPELTQDHPGLLGAVTSRAEAQVLRLAMDFAQFDAAARIELQHLEAALCFWRYSFDSAAYIFEGAEIDPIAQQIVEALAKGQMSQNDIVNLFGRNVRKDRLDGVLKDLQDRGRVTLTKEGGTGGRPRSVWRLAL